MILSHPFQHHFCLGKPPLLHFLWTDFALALSMLCNNLLDLAGVSPHPGKAAEMRRGAGDGWGCLCAASICRVCPWEGGWWPRRAEWEVPVAVQGCSWQKSDNVKSLNESGKDFAHRGSSEWGSGGEVCGELLAESWAYPSCPVQNRVMDLRSQGQRCVGIILLLLEESCCEWDSLDFLVVEGQKDWVLTLKYHFPLFPLRHYVVSVVVCESIHSYTTEWLNELLRPFWKAFPSLRMCLGALSALSDYCLPAPPLLLHSPRHPVKISTASTSLSI